MLHLVLSCSNVYSTLYCFLNIYGNLCIISLLHSLTQAPLLYHVKIVKLSRSPNRHCKDKNQLNSHILLGALHCFSSVGDFCLFSEFLQGFSVITSTSWFLKMVEFSGKTLFFKGHQD